MSATKYFTLLRLASHVCTQARNRSSAAAFQVSFEKLSQRSLIKVHGPDSLVFLQGLITNDVNHFETGATAMYTMFLNNKGRVIQDSIIYRSTPHDCYLVECENEHLDSLLKHLKLYRVRKKVDIDSVQNELGVWCLIPVKEDNNTVKSKSHKIFRDPRLVQLGFRVIAESEQDLIQTVSDEFDLCTGTKTYKAHRYELGVAEGTQEITPGVSFPLEMNCDFLHGVSFHKGCYIGQELTARTYHTGVIRKRIMPIQFESLLSESLSFDSAVQSVTNDKTVSVGKLKGVKDNFGIALLRVNEALAAPILKIGDHVIQCRRPSWWPLELVKERRATT